MMKFIFLTLFIILNVLLRGQSNLIVNDSINGGEYITFHDTTISCDPQETCYYLIDLNNDSIDDITFTFESDGGSWGYSFSTWVTTYNDFFVVANTSFLAHHQYIDFTNPDNPVIKDTILEYTVVKKYLNGDTISLNEPYETSNTISKHLLTCDPYIGDYTSFNIHPFSGPDTEYMALYKMDGTLTWIYYFEVSFGGGIRLKAARTNDENIASIDSKYFYTKLFPNPVNDWLNIESNYDQIQIFSINGKMIISEKIANNNHRINLSFLKQGMYFISLISEDSKTVKKIIKN